MKNDAISAIVEQLGDRNSVNICININNGEKFAEKIYREDGRVFVDVNEPDLYDRDNIVLNRYIIGRLSFFELVALLDGLESA